MKYVDLDTRLNSFHPDSFDRSKESLFIVEVLKQLHVFCEKIFFSLEGHEGVMFW